MAGGRFMYFFTDHVALGVGFAYNNHTELNPRTSFRSMMWESTLRVFVPRKRLTPFFELGYGTPRYWVTGGGHTYTEIQSGVRVGFGLALLLGKGHSLDLSINQLFNDPGRYEVLAALGASAPCPPGVDCYYQRPLPGEAFNESMLELIYRLGL
jgi:hypothetical protein